MTEQHEAEQALLPLTPEAPPDLKQQSIRPDRLNIRETPKPDAALRHSVGTWGVLKPVLVHRVENAHQDDEGQYGFDLIVVDGNRRTLAAKQAIESELLPDDYAIPCVVTSDLGYLQNVARIMLNATQDRNPIAEMEAIDELLRQGYSESQIASETGMAVGTIRQRLRYLNLIPAIKKAVDEGFIKPSVATHLVKLSATEQEALVARLTVEGKPLRIKLQDVKQARTAATQAATLALPSALWETPGLDDEPVEEATEAVKAAYDNLSPEDTTVSPYAKQWWDETDPETQLGILCDTIADLMVEHGYKVKMVEGLLRESLASVKARKKEVQ